MPLTNSTTFIESIAPFAEEPRDWTYLNYLMTKEDWLDGSHADALDHVVLRQIRSLSAITANESASQQAKDRVQAKIYANERDLGEYSEETAQIVAERYRYNKQLQIEAATRVIEGSRDINDLRMLTDLTIEYHYWTLSSMHGAKADLEEAQKEDSAESELVPFLERFYKREVAEFDLACEAFLYSMALYKEAQDKDTLPNKVVSET